MKRMFVITVISLLLLSTCGGTPTVQRVESGTEPDLSGYWNAHDVRIVCDSLLKDCFSSPRVDQILREAGSRRPTVIVGRFRNESSEHIDTEILSTMMETTIFNSGRMDFVAPANLREELRAERLDQQGNASVETAARLGREIGANYMMTGNVRTIIDREGNRTVRTYFVTAELTNIETNARVWIGQNNEITKIVTRPRNSL